jgi:hypothetical protein
VAQRRARLLAHIPPAAAMTATNNDGAGPRLWRADVEYVPRPRPEPRNTGRPARRPPSEKIDRTSTADAALEAVGLREQDT